MTLPDALSGLAEAAGVTLTYLDNTGTRQTPPEETVRSTLRAMGHAVGTDAELRQTREALRAERAARRLPDHVVSEAGTAPQLLLPDDADWRLATEDGGLAEGRGGTLPALGPGRHRLETRDETCWILSAPAALPLPAAAWGVTLPLYGLRGPERGGLGDYADLAAAARGLARAGAAFVGINPVHAGFAGDAAMISPYTPSHRRRLSTAHLYAAGEAAPGNGELVDYGRALAARRAALEAEFAAFRDDGAFAAYRDREGAALERFATYEALAEIHGPTWDAWPGAVRDPDAEAVRRFAAERGDRLAFHAWLQFRAEEQLDAASSAARAAGMAQGLYLDLAVGTHPHGAETWGERACFAYGVALGAPPDAFSPAGQNWALAPFNPRHLLATGFAPLAATLRAQMRFAGILRIDHILGFARTFWVPEGLPGTYVEMPKDAMFAVARIEAARAGAAIVGEDLGNVPEGFRDDLAACNILGCEVAMFEPDRPATDYREKALASFGTHDLPTWIGWREGRDIAARARLGGIDEAAVEAAMATRAQEVRSLLARIGGAGDADALHAFLARGSARLVAVQAEDMLGVADQANLPGTTREYPNWRRRLPVDARDLGDDPRVARTGALMRAAGR